MNARVLGWLEKTCDRLMDQRTYVVPEVNERPKPRIVAHRGAWSSDCVENTMAAFRRAREFKAWAIEFDVHFTKDDQPVIHHDPDLARVFSRSELIRERTWSELRAMNLGIPHLEEVLALTDLHFMLEVKTALSADQQFVLEHHLSHKAPLVDYHLLTLDPSLVRLSSVLPGEAWILVGDIHLARLAIQAEQMRLGGVAAHYLTLSNYWLRWLHTRGLKVGVGFVPTTNLYRREWARGVDFVFTNNMPALSSVSN